MRKLVAYRLFGAVPLLVLVAVTVFLLTHMMPGSPAGAILGDEADPESIAALEEKLGLDRPITAQFATWFRDAITGDLGESLFIGRPVNDLLAERMAPTLSMASSALLVAIVLGVGGGLVAALRHGSLVDRLVAMLTAAGLAIPGFWLGIILLLLFAVTLGWLPVISWRPPSQGLAGWARGLILPSIALGLGGSAVLARQTRSAMLEALESPFVQTLRAIGTPRRTIILRYALKNALVPVITMVAFQFLSLLGTSFVIERVFTIPGIGALLLDGVIRKDIPVVQGVTLVVAVAVVVVYLVIDVCYGVINPRARPQ